MEVIRLSGYTEIEKLEIAKKFLVPKQMKDNGLAGEVEFQDDGLKELITYYSREAGVRNLEREVGNVCRKIARQVVVHASKTDADKGDLAKAVIDAKKVNDLLGPQKFRAMEAEKQNQIGATVGLAWTEMGGQILTTETTIMEGRGKLTTTGKLGDVMQESAHAAMSYVRSRAQLLGLPKDFYRHLDIHVHVPEGAIPKDGPSAGITIATSITSALTNIPVRCDIAMTGEITVRGRVLAIGGLKEKILAAYRHGIREVVLPKDNEKDIPEIPEYIRNEMKVHVVESMDQVLKIALERDFEAGPVSTNAPVMEITRSQEENKSAVSH